jgi:RHS repeat-associated protein
VTTAVSQQPQASYSYDNDGRLTSITQDGQDVTLAYDTASRPQSATLPDGITQGYAYDPASNVTGITYTSGGTTLGDLDYAYDPDGNLTAEWGTYARLTIPQPFGPATYNADNALITATATSYSYDNDGNLTSDGTSTYTWNPRGQLTSIAGPVPASYSYDPFGRRQQAVLGGTTTSYLNDGPNVAQETASGTVTASYLLGPGLDQRYARTDTTGTSSYLTDPLGSVIALADPQASIQTSYTYTPAGQPAATGTASANPYQYTGRENDGTGLQYNRARYYNPATSQFTSQDPLSTATRAAASLYAYADDNPVNQTDPTGLSPSLPPGPGFCVAGIISGVKDIASSAGCAVGTALLLIAPEEGILDEALTLEADGIDLAAEVVPNEGIYIVRTPTGDYVGQSGNIAQRLARHVYNGKFKQAEVDAAERIAVSGGKTAREIAEQLKIDEMGGIEKLLNEVNPIGPARFSLMPNQPYVR